MTNLWHIYQLDNVFAYFSTQDEMIFVLLRFSAVHIRHKNTFYTLKKTILPLIIIMEVRLSVAGVLKKDIPVGCIAL